jgi:general secretion pathway protein D
LSASPGLFDGHGSQRHQSRCSVLTVVALAFALSACAPFPSPRVQLESAEQAARASHLPDVADQGEPLAPETREERAAGFYAPGNDRMTARPGPTAPGPTAPTPGAATDGVTLNFENTSLLEVVKVLLGDLLGRSYVVDPAVQGTVTLQSTTPIPRDALTSTLEMMLRMNGAALVDDGSGLLRVVPREKAVLGSAAPQLGDSAVPLPRGFGLRVVPLRYVSAQEMRGILEPIVDPGSIVRVDTRRNLLILAGSSGELARLLDAVELFDVDWMAGMSVALFRPAFVDASTLADELGALMQTQTEGALEGVVRFVVIERLNGLLVVTPRREYLARVRDWVARLDQASGGAGQRLFVYHVQNGKAVELAEVLAEVFREEGADQPPPPTLAPGLEPAQLGGAEAPAAGQEAQGDAAAPSAPAPPQRAAVVPSPGTGLALSTSAPIRIIADEVNNALLILAGAEQYRQVEAAIRQLDIAPLQVLIEATIAEVRLEDALSQGVEWFLKNDVGAKRGIATLDLADAGIAALTPGFSYAITDAAGVVRAVLNALASDSRAKIISSPSLMVLNNQKAAIQVGDQVPITTQQQQATSENANVVNSIEYRETGVLLTVTPRVNSGGLVTMEVEQEVSNVAANAENPLAPTIQQRKINSTVAVQSGETVVLGGLIREDDNRTASGIPGLRDLPVVGWFFGASRDELVRSELVVLITPRAVRGAVQAREVTEEFRYKMDSLKPIEEPPRGFGPWYHKLDRLPGYAPTPSAQPGESPPRPPPTTTSSTEHGMRMERTLGPGRPSRPSAREPEAAPRAPVPLASSGRLGRAGFSARPGGG